MHYSISMRLVLGLEPGKITRDVLNADWVIDSTGKYLTLSEIQNHIDSGAAPAILASLPNGEINNVNFPGIKWSIG